MPAFICPTCSTRTDPAPHTTAPSRCGHFVLVAGECNVVATRALAVKVVYSETLADALALWPLMELASDGAGMSAKSRTEKRVAALLAGMT